MKLKRSESRQILLILIGVQILFIKFYFNQVSLLLRLNEFLIYVLTIFSISLLILTFVFTLKNKLILLILLCSISISFSIPSIMIYTGSQKVVNKEVFIITSKEYNSSLSKFSPIIQNVNMISQDGYEIRLRGNIEIYNSCQIGDEIEITYHEN